MNRIARLDGLMERAGTVRDGIGPALALAAPAASAALAGVALAHPAVAAGVSALKSGLRLAHLSNEDKEHINADPGKYIGLNTTILMALLNEMLDANSLIAYPTGDMETQQRRKNVITYLNNQISDVYGPNIPQLNIHAITTARDEDVNEEKLLALEPPTDMRGGYRRRTKRTKRKKRTKHKKRTKRKKRTK